VTTSLAASHGQPVIAKRAEGYGVPGVTCDGQDVLAVYEATAAAVDRARRGEGPTLLEARTYRFDEHSVGLPTLGGAYRSKEEVEDQIANRDPIALFRQVLLDAGAPAEALVALESEVVQEVEGAIAFGRNSPAPDPGDVWDYMYASAVARPKELAEIGR
jgi:pyruvate dehydrogenase E1 component alpha subunit